MTLNLKQNIYIIKKDLKVCMENFIIKDNLSQQRLKIYKVSKKKFIEVY